MFDRVSDIARICSLSSMNDTNIKSYSEDITKIRSKLLELLNPFNNKETKKKQEEVNSANNNLYLDTIKGKYGSMESILKAVSDLNSTLKDK